MTDQFNRDVRSWLCDPLDFETGPGGGEPALVRAILNDFWSLYPEYATRDPDAITSQLNAIAQAAGHANVERMIGSSICLSDGGRSLRLSIAKGERLSLDRVTA